MTGAIEAGRLEVPVEANTSGFAAELKRKIEAAAEGLAAKIGVDPDGDGLRRKLREVIDEAAAGLDADVEVGVNSKTLRTRLRTAVDEAQAGLRAEVEVDVSAHGLRERLQAVVKTAAAGVRAHVGVDVDQDGAGTGPVQSVTGRDNFTPWYRRWRRVRQAEADANPIGLGVTVSKWTKEDNSSFLGEWLGNFKQIDRFAAMAARKAMLLVGIASIVQPAIAAIVGSLGSAIGMLGNLSTMVAVLAAAPGAIAGLVSVIGTLMIAFSGFTGELADMPPKMRAAAKAVRSFKDDWADLTKSVKESFWDGLADPIKQTGEKFLPALKDGLTGSAEALNGVANRLLRFMRSDDFLADLGNVFTQINGDGSKSAGVIERLGGAFQAFLSGTMDLMVAAGPLLDKVANGVQNLANKWATAWDTDAEKKELGDFLDYAWSKAQQAGRIIGDVWDAIAGIFRAGRGTNDSLLVDLERQTQKLADWVNSPQGAQAISQWFEDVAPIAKEAGGLIVDLVAAILDLAADPGTAALLAEMREGLLPALKSFFETLGQTLGPAVITLLTELGELLANLGQSGGSMSTAVEAINAVLGALNDFLESHPDAADFIGSVVAALVGFTAIKPLLAKTGVLTLLGSTLSAIAGGLTGLKGAGGKGGLSGLLGGITGKGTAGAGGTTAGAPGGVGFGTRLLGQLVYWNAALPVYVTNLGGLGGDTGGPTIVDPGIDGKNNSGKPSSKTNTPRVSARGGRAGRLGNALSRLFGAGATVSGVSNSGAAWGTKANGAATAARTGLGGAVRNAATGLRNGVSSIGSRISGLFGRGGAAASVKPGGIPGGASGFVSNSGKAATAIGSKVATATKSGGLLGGLLGSSGVRTVGRGLLTGVKGLAGGVGGLVAGIAGDAAGNAIKDGNGGLRDVGGSMVSGAATGAGIGATIGSIVPGVGTAIGGAVGGVIGGVGGALTSGADWSQVADEIGVAWSNVKTWTADTWSSVKSNVSGAWDSVSSWTSTAASNVGNAVSTGWNNVTSWTSSTWNGVTSGVSGAWNSVTSAVSTGASTVGTAVSTGWSNVQTWTGNAWNSVTSTVGGAWSSVQSGVSTGMSNVGSFLSTGWSNVQSTASGAWSSFQQAASGGLGGVLSSAGSFIGQLTQKFTGVNLFDAGKSIIQGFLRGVESIYNSVKNSLTDFTKKLVDWKGPPKKDATLLTGAGRSVIGGFLDGLEGSYGGVKRSLQAFTSDLSGSADVSLGAVGAAGVAARSASSYTSAAPGGVVFEKGSIVVHNPTAEPASTSISSSLRSAAALLSPNGAS